MISLAPTLAAAIPDDPQWIDIRGMLLSPHAHIYGGDSLESGFVIRVAHQAVSCIGVVGRPDAHAIRHAVLGMTGLTPVVCQIDNADHVRRALDGWIGEPAIVHTLASGAASMARGPRESARLLAADESALLSHLPPGLKHEMTAALSMVPLAATFAGDIPVSFCYPVWLSEVWWDVSIDTLEEHRGRGHAFAAMQVMTAVMQETGRNPIWSALASNKPSLNLAKKLGFTPVGTVTVFSRNGSWVLLSGGFEG